MNERIKELRINRNMGCIEMEDGQRCKLGAVD